MALLTFSFLNHFKTCTLKVNNQNISLTVLLEQCSGHYIAGRASLVKFSESLAVPLDDKFLDGYTKKFEVELDRYELKSEKNEIHSESIFKRGEMVLLTMLVTSLETLSMFCWFGYALMPDGKYFSFYVDMAINAISDIVFSVASVLFNSVGRRGIMVGSSGISLALVVLAITCQAFSFYQATRWLNFLTKGFITIINLTSITYKSEVMPTTVRAEGVAFSQIISKLAVALARYLHIFGTIICRVLEAGK